MPVLTVVTFCNNSGSIVYFWYDWLVWVLRLHCLLLVWLIVVGFKKPSHGINQLGGRGGTCSSSAESSWLVVWVHTLEIELVSLSSDKMSDAMRMNRNPPNFTTLSLFSGPIICPRYIYLSTRFETDKVFPCCIHPPRIFVILWCHCHSCRLQQCKNIIQILVAKGGCLMSPLQTPQTSRSDNLKKSSAHPNHYQLSLMTVFTWIPLITMLWSPNLKKDEMGNKSICVWMLLSTWWGVGWLESVLHIYVHNYENEHLSSVKRDNLQPCFSIIEKVLTNI